MPIHLSRDLKEKLPLLQPREGDPFHVQNGVIVGMEVGDMLLLQDMIPLNTDLSKPERFVPPLVNTLGCRYLGIFVIDGPGPDAFENPALVGELLALVGRDRLIFQWRNARVSWMTSRGHPEPEGEHEYGNPDR